MTKELLSIAGRAVKEAIAESKKKLKGTDGYGSGVNLIISLK